MTQSCALACCGGNAFAGGLVPDDCVNVCSPFVRPATTSHCPFGPTARANECSAGTPSNVIAFSCTVYCGTFCATSEAAQRSDRAASLLVFIGVSSLLR